MHRYESVYSYPRKRQRLSSPTYDEQFELSQDELQAFDEVDKSLSQHSASRRPSQSISQIEKRKRHEAIAEALKQQDEAGDPKPANGAPDIYSSSPLKNLLKSNQKMHTMNPISNTEHSYEHTATQIKPISKMEPSKGFASAASLTPTMHTEPVADHDIVPDAGLAIITTPNKFQGFGFASALQTRIEPQSHDENTPELPSSSPDFAPPEEDSTWFNSTSIPENGGGFQSAKALVPSKGGGMQPIRDRVATPSGVTSARTMIHDNSSSTPQEIVPDDSTWFNLVSIPEGVSGFLPAKALVRPEDISHSADASTAPLPGFTSGSELLQQDISLVAGAVESLPGFTSGTCLLARSGAGIAPGTGNTSKKGWVAPSAAAIAKAQAMMSKWTAEIEAEFASADDPSSSLDQENLTRQSVPPALGFKTPGRPVLNTVDNISTISPAQAPDTPSPTGVVIGFGRPAVNAAKPISSGKGKVFKSPLKMPSKQPAGHASPYVGSPLNPHRLSNFPPAPKLPAAFPHIAAESNTADALAPVRSIGFTPGNAVKQLGLTPRRVAPVMTNKPKFATPFKPGMRPGEPGRNQLGSMQSPKITSVFTTNAPMNGVQHSVKKPSSKGKERESFFDLSRPVDRTTLASSGLVPQSYTTDDLESIDINVQELRQIVPDLAIYYSFHTSSSTPPSTQLAQPEAIQTLGPTEALDELLAMGCSLATKAWVDNHWGLILWKLAGMVCLQPELECVATTRRWCWPEVMRQLRYRYERELNRGSRPPLRLIVTQDAPASLPMVLCISDVTWSAETTSDDGSLVPPFPELEVTDGWYRVRAQIDEPMARAVHKGFIRIGRKIEVAGARLSSDRKEPCEILEAPGSVSLKLSGNSTSLAPWHAKLGFAKHTFTSTLASLTPDGGLVARMDLEIVKAYPVAYLEFIEQEDGRKRREGPRGEKEEAVLNDKWTARRDSAASKLRLELEAKQQKWAGYVERLERKAGSFCPKEDNGPPDNIDDLYDELDNCTNVNVVLSRLSADEAGWLARYIIQQSERDRERGQEEIEQELNSICPPREVRNFRVIVAQDVRTSKRPAYRQVQLTVWDVLGMTVNEGGKAGNFTEGQRFVVTNLLPNQQKAWMGPEAESIVYLTTRRDTRWTRIN